MQKNDNKNTLHSKHKASKTILLQNSTCDFTSRRIGYEDTDTIARRPKKFFRIVSIFERFFYPSIRASIKEHYEKVMSKICNLLCCTFMFSSEF